MSLFEHGRPNPVSPAASQLTGFQTYLERKNRSGNTIRAYLFAVRQFLDLYPQVDHNYMMLYKCYLMEHYKPQTGNLRIRSINCYMECQKHPETKVPMVRLQHKSFLENVISQADYEYLKTRLLQDEHMTCYYAVWLMASTGLRISELIQLQVHDIRRGYMDIHSKGNRIRRVYIPKHVRTDCKQWLYSLKRTSGDVFLNRYGSRISPAGIRDQLKRYAIQYDLDPSVVHPHAFRHLFAKNFIESCGDIALLADILGHESIETTRIYLTKSSQEQQKLLDEIVTW
ncbi:MAG: tyrosine-type recombinase/integrase [Lachnospiraceae bacterium]|nr:tyrosine-type recombinase/integrase [Lachnospiraceae bacterium]